MTIKVRRIDFSPDEWLAGTLELTPYDRGVYITICALIYSRGGWIDLELVRRHCGVHAHGVNAAVERLCAAHKVVRNGSEISQKRCGNELENAQKRVENARENGAKGGRPKDLAKPKGFVRRKANHQPSTCLTTSSSREDVVKLVRARDATPLAVARGDGAALRAPSEKAEPEAPTVFEDAALKADAVAALDRCLEAIQAKAAALAAAPPPIRTKPRRTLHDWQEAAE